MYFNTEKEARHCCLACNLSALFFIRQILRFEDSECCNNFMTELRNFLESLGVTIKTTCMSEAQIKENSISRDERQAVLDEFFRLACLQVCVRLCVVV